MRTWYLFSVWLHILAATVWIGGMAFLGLVLVPVIRGRDFDGVRTALLYRTGMRFRWIAWTILVLLIGTGFLNLWFRGFVWSDLWMGTLWRGAWGQTLAWKLALVGLVLVISAVHDFVLGPRATHLLDQYPDAARSKRLRRVASYAGRLLLFVALAIVALAVVLVRGLP
jgi:copper resistance protein D